MKTFVFVIFVALQILTISSNILPKNFPQFCPKSTQNYNKCMENAFQKMGPYFLKGIKSIGFPKIHPLTIPSFSISRTLSENITVASELKNLQFYGYDKMELRSFDFNPNTLQGIISLYIPNLDFKIEYNVVGRLLSLDITNAGFAAGNASGLDLEFNLKLKKINKVGIDYLTIDDIKVKGNIQDSHIKLVAKNPASQATSDLLSYTFNENTREILDIVHPIYEDSLATYYGSFIEKFLSSVPAREIIPE